MKRFSGLIIALTIFAFAHTVWAAPAQRCVTAPLGNSASKTSQIYTVRPDSAPWAVWLGTAHGTAGTVTVNGYGPCLDNRSAATCARGAAFVLASLSSGTTAAFGTGPIDAVQFVATGACGTPTCVGGTNENGVCSTDSACPGSTCGPCSTSPSFCGVNSSGQE